MVGRKNWKVRLVSSTEKSEREMEERGKRERVCVKCESEECEEE